MDPDETQQLEEEALDEYQQFNILLSVLVDLSTIYDYDTAISQIEVYGDTIDDVCALVERLQWHKEFVLEGGLDSLLKMLSCVCDEVVNLSLSGLERILSRWEVAEHAGKAGAFEQLVGIIIKHRDSADYARAKASDVLAFLLAPSPNRYLKEQALNHTVFDAHMDMLFSGNENLVERGLQFLWCMTNSYPDAQRKVCRSPQIIEKILKEITDSDAGKNALRVLHNIAIHESALVTLPLPDIEKILTSILKIPQSYIEARDKEIAAMILASLSSGINVAVVGVLVLNQLVKTLHDYLHDEGRHYHLPDIIQALNHIVTTLLHKDLDVVVEESNVANEILFLLATGGSVASSEDKALASQVALSLVKRRLALKTFQNEDALEVLEILEDSDDERLVRNCYSILRLLREVATEEAEHKKNIEDFHDSPKPHRRITVLSPRLPELHPRATLLSHSNELPIQVPSHEFVEEKEGKEEKDGKEEKKEIRKEENGTNEPEGGAERVNGEKVERAHEPEIDKDKQIPEKSHIPHEPHEPQKLKEIPQVDDAAAQREMKVEKSGIHHDNPLPHDPPQDSLVPDTIQVPLSPISTPAPLPSSPSLPPLSSAPVETSPEGISEKVEKVEHQEPKTEVAQNGNHQALHDSSSLLKKEISHEVQAQVSTEPQNGHSLETSDSSDSRAHRESESVKATSTLEIPNEPAREIPLPKAEVQVYTGENHISKESQKRKVDLASWSSEDVCEWLSELGLAQYKETFTTQRITGRSMRELTRRVDDLQFLQFLCTSLHLTIGDLFTFADGLRELRQ